MPSPFHSIFNQIFLATTTTRKSAIKTIPKYKNNAVNTGNFIPESNINVVKEVFKQIIKMNQHHNSKQMTRVRTKMEKKNPVQIPK